MAQREPLPRTPEEVAWKPLDPQGAREFLAELGAPWWIVGGWAIEAFTGVPREHDDVDATIFRRDLPRLRELAAGRFHLWSVGSGMLRPLDDRFPEPHADGGQVWVRWRRSPGWPTTA